jgi:hypothetical protein
MNSSLRAVACRASLPDRIVGLSLCETNLMNKKIMSNI